MRETASSVSVFPAKMAAGLTHPVLFLALQLSQLRHLQITQSMLVDWSLETVSPFVEPWFITLGAGVTDLQDLGLQASLFSSGPLLQP